MFFVRPMRCYIGAALIPVVVGSFASGTLPDETVRGCNEDDCTTSVEYAMLLQLSLLSVDINEQLSVDINGTSLVHNGGQIGAMTTTPRTGEKKSNDVSKTDPGELRNELDVRDLRKVNKTQVTDTMTVLADQLVKPVGLMVAGGVVFCAVLGVYCCCCNSSPSSDLSEKAVERKTADDPTQTAPSQKGAKQWSDASRGTTTCCGIVPSTKQRQTQDEARIGVGASGDRNDIEKLFTAATKSATLGGAVPKLSNDQKLFMYSHFKQATQGDATGSRPGMFDPVNRAKFDAWKGITGMDRVVAMRKYVEKADTLAPGWREDVPRA